MPVRFLNESSFIRAVDTRTLVESFYNKRGLVVQAMNDPSDLSFFLRSDGYTGYYRFEEVEAPSKPNMEALLSQLGAWAFDRLYAETFAYEPRTVLELRVQYDKAPLRISEARNDAEPYPRGPGGSLASPGLDAPVGSYHDPDAREVVMSAPVDSSAPGTGGGRVVRQSKEYAACPADKHLVATVTGTLLDPAVIGGADYSASHSDPAVMAPSAGARYRLGVFDDAGDASGAAAEGAGNGVYVEYNYDPARAEHLPGASSPNPHAAARMSSMTAAQAAAYSSGYAECKLWVVLRTGVSGAGVEWRVPRTDWADPLSSSEGSLFDADPTTPQTYVFRWSASPGSKVGVGVLHSGVVNWVHEFDSGGGRLGSSSLPVRWELDNRLGAAAASMRQGRAVVSCDGMYEVPGRPYSFDTHLNQTVLTTRTPVPVMSLRLRPGRCRGKIHPQRLSLMNRDAGGVLKYELRLNAVLTGATFASSESFSYDDPAGGGSLSLGGFGSFAEVDTAATGVSGGLTVASGFFTDTAFRDVALDFREIRLCADISGAADTLTLVCTYMQGVSTVSAGIGWLEYD